MKKPTWPILTLAALAAMCGELLSGSSPPLEFFTPFGLIGLTALYGSGALMVRDLARRWGKGWVSVWLLGAAYGIYEEGIAVRSFFDPTWGDLGILAEYGRWLGVNWVWAFTLTLFHATVSITIPIVVVELLFPAHRDEVWLGRWGWVIGALLFLPWVAFGPLVGMKAPFLGLLGCVVVIGELALVARLWPAPTGPPAKIVHPLLALLLVPFGCGSTITFIGVMWLLPESGVPVALTLGASVVLPLLVGGVAWVLGGRAWTDRHRWAFVSGALLPWIVLAFAQEADNAARPDDTRGMAMVGLAFLVFLIGLGVTVWRRDERAADDSKLPSREYPQRPIVSVHAAVFRGEHVLLVKRANPPSQGLWSLPGGVIEVGETIHEAARRELREECGVEIETGSIVSVADNIIPDEEGRTRYHYVLICVLGRHVSGEARPGSDAPEVRWAARDELGALDMNPLARKAALQAFGMVPEPRVSP